MVTRDDCGHDGVQAALSVLLELTHVLGEYREEIVVIGGWVPGLLCPDAAVGHTGSLDVGLEVF